MFSARSLSRDDPLPLRRRRRREVRSPRFPSCATLVNATAAAAHPRRPSAFPAKKKKKEKNTRPLTHIMACSWLRLLCMESFFFCGRNRATQKRAKRAQERLLPSRMIPSGFRLRTKFLSSSQLCARASQYGLLMEF